MKTYNTRHDYLKVLCAQLQREAEELPRAEKVGKKPYPSRTVLELYKSLQGVALKAYQQVCFQQPLVEEIIHPLCTRLAHVYESQHGKPLWIGLSGGQGTGKSTLSLVLKYLLETGLGYRVLLLSLDDFYLSKHERLHLAQTLHPLFKTRGVPGTHDVSRIIKILKQVEAYPFAKGADSVQDTLKIPIFSKGLDTCLPQVREEKLPFDMVILEGWCVGVCAEPEEALRTPLNDLEATADPNGVWRTEVNQQLQGEYARLFRRIAYLIYLLPPNFEAVLTYRLEQERMLPSEQQMSLGALKRFISHYERLTRHSFQETATRADALIRLGETQRQGSTLKFRHN